MYACPCLTARNMLCAAELPGPRAPHTCRQRYAYSLQDWGQSPHQDLHHQTMAPWCLVCSVQQLECKGLDICILKSLSEVRIAAADTVKQATRWWREDSEPCTTDCTCSSLVKGALCCIHPGALSTSLLRRTHSLHTSCCCCATPFSCSSLTLKSAEGACSRLWHAVWKPAGALELMESQQGRWRSCLLSVSQTEPATIDTGAAQQIC